MTQEELAEKLNISRQTVSNWENNKCYPDIETLVIISNKFNISLDILIKENKKMVNDIDKKIKISKKIKYSRIALFVVLIIGGIIIYSKNNKIDNVLAKNNELKEEIKKFTEIKEGNVVYALKIDDIDIKNISLDYHNINIYANEKLIAENVKVINYKDLNGNTVSSFDSLEFIILEVSNNIYKILQEVNNSNEKILLENANY